MACEGVSTPAFYEERIRLLQNLYDELFAQTEQLRAERQQAQKEIRQLHLGLQGAQELLDQRTAERQQAIDNAERLRVHLNECRIERQQARHERDAAVAERQRAVKIANRLEEQAVQAIDALRDAEVFYPEAVALIRELVVDAEGIYEPEKGWPDHIERAHNLGDHDETIAQIRAALLSLGEQQ